MPVFTTTIKLESGTTHDYECISAELIKKSFRPIKSDSAIVLSTNQANLFDVTSSVSAAAVRTGKKYSFSVRKNRE